VARHVQYDPLRRRSGRQGLEPIAGGEAVPRRSGRRRANKKAEVGIMKKIAVTVALVGAFVLASAVVARADVKDSWITTKAKIALLTMDGFSVNGVDVDTIKGRVTIHGKVATAADRTRAEATVRGVDGVKSVKNLLQVVAAKAMMMTIVTDEDVKGRVEASLKTDVKMNDVKVSSVNQGVVLLSGKAEDLSQSLRAIENAYTVEGVHRVASEIQTTTNN
jgi:hyperosmotically inducible periplasmic protein